MNLVEYLLTCLSEECAEIAQRASKANRFGLDEVQPGQDLSNRDRLHSEIDDLMGTLAVLRDEGIFDYQPDAESIEAKKAKVYKFMRYARECGTLETPPSLPMNYSAAMQALKAGKRVRRATWGLGYCIALSRGGEINNPRGLPCAPLSDEDMLAEDWLISEA